MNKFIPQKLKNIYHLGQAILANFIYGFPSRKIKVIGVTGTNGKTTTVQMIARILEEAGKSARGGSASGGKVAVASTINFKIGDREWVNATKFTTLSPFKVQKFIQEAVKAGCEYLVLETSSHSLDQFRVWGIGYKIAVITNVTREHLDYHKNMEDYRKAKSILFKNLNINFQFSISNFQSIFNSKILKNQKKISIVNLDMDLPEHFLKYEADEKYGYTTNEQGSVINDKKIEIIRAENIKLEKDKSLFTVHCSLFTVNLPGQFNVENALAAISVGIAENISLEIMSRALEKIKNIPGRFEFVENNKDLNIIIDYAVTPDSLEKLYDLIKSIKGKGNIISVFGSCGDRDRGKRPIMGKIVTSACDFSIVTNEDPYSEDPQKIIDEICSGIIEKKEERDFCRILDRREAIKKALQIAKPGDYVVITGKGAEETMAIGNKRIPWNDREIVMEELSKL